MLFVVFEHRRNGKQKGNRALISQLCSRFKSSALGPANTWRNKKKHSIAENIQAFSAKRLLAIDRSRRVGSPLVFHSWQYFEEAMQAIGERM